MTNKEAVEIIKTARAEVEWEYPMEYAAAFDKAIEALEKEPCEDAISRQAVDELSKELVHTTRDKADFLCNFWEGLQKLPSVTPQAKDKAIEV